MLHNGLSFVFFNDTATTEIYTLSLHDALPIYRPRDPHRQPRRRSADPHPPRHDESPRPHRRIHRHRQDARSEEHTSELQSRQYLVCRLLLEKKKSTSSTSFGAKSRV